MANNVFGIPITDATLKGMPEYVGREITRRDRARVAILMKNAENKDHDARNHVEKLQQKNRTLFVDGISALCVIYNATGDTLKYITTHDYDGYIYEDQYPAIIQNGQWAAFLHVKDAVKLSGSSAAVVYRGKNQSGQEHDWMLAWSIPFIGDNHRALAMRGRIRSGGFRRRSGAGKGFGVGRTDGLRELVPGGGAMDLCSLLDETAHYIKCLTTQILVKSNLISLSDTSW